MKTKENENQNDVDNKNQNLPADPSAADNSTGGEEEEDSTTIFATLTEDSGGDSDAGDVKSGENGNENDADPDPDGASDDDEDKDSDEDSETSGETDSTKGKDGDENDPDSETNGSDDAEKLQRDLKAQSGRVRGLNRALDEERKRNKQMMEELATLREQSRKLKEQSPEESGIIPDDELKALEEDFPESAKIARAYVSKALRELAGKDEKVVDYLISQTERTEKDLTNSELQRLEENHPDYMDIVQDERFAQWVSLQPPAVQRAVESESADDASFVLDLYKQQTGSTGGGEGQTDRTVANGQAKTDGASEKPKPKKRDLSDHAELPNKGGSRVAQDTDDPISLFEQIASEDNP